MAGAAGGVSERRVGVCGRRGAAAASPPSPPGLRHGLRPTHSAAADPPGERPRPRPPLPPNYPLCTHARTLHARRSSGQTYSPQIVTDALLQREIPCEVMMPRSRCIIYTRCSETYPAAHGHESVGAPPHARPEAALPGTLATLVPNDNDNRKTLSRCTAQQSSSGQGASTQPSGKRGSRAAPPFPSPAGAAAAVRGGTAAEGRHTAAGGAPPGEVDAPAAPVARRALGVGCLPGTTSTHRHLVAHVCRLFHQRVAESHFRPWAAWSITISCLLLMSGREDKGSEGQQ